MNLSVGSVFGMVQFFILLMEEKNGKQKHKQQIILFLQSNFLIMIMAGLLVAVQFSIQKTEV
jgi:hypothetical protein